MKKRIPNSNWVNAPYKVYNVDLITGKRKLVRNMPKSIIIQFLPRIDIDGKVFEK